MEQNLFQSDGNYRRLGFLLLQDGTLIPFGYRDLYDVVVNVGYENIDYTYHNSSLLKEIEHHPYLETLKVQLERDYGSELIYSPYFSQKQVLTVLARDYQITAFKMVNAPDTGEKRDFLVIASNLSNEAYEALKQLNQTNIFQRLQLCRWIQNEEEYIDYDGIEDFLKDYQARKRK